jgi:outer membrane protein OmpA-like peptidoglycan-associated protein
MAAPSIGKNGSEDSSEGPNDRQIFEELRNILLGREKKEIAALRNRLENPASRTADVSAVVAEAIELRRDRGGQRELNKALTPSVEEALSESVRKDPSVLAGALFPVMGPAIRKSITESIRAMLESFNEALDHSFSLQGIRWRIESIRTGKPFAEIVLLHGLLFRVEQVFLIHKATGLVLGHCVAPRVAIQDPALVSGMLSAIQSYVRDSFQSPKEDSLDSLQVGDLEVWIEEGPQAILAAVIRGHAPASYRETLKKTIEEIHRNFGLALERFDGDSSALALADQQLSLCLESHSLPKSVTRRKPYVLILAIAAVVLFGIWAAIGLRNQIRWNRFAEAVQSQPGIVVTSVEKEDGRRVVRGLRDPLASDTVSMLRNAQIDPAQVRFQWTPFYALDDEIVRRRAIETLHPEPGMTLSVRDGTLTATGSASTDLMRRLMYQAALIPGVRKVDTSRLEEREGPEVIRLEAALRSTLFTFSVGSAIAGPDQEAKFGRAAEQIKLLLAKEELPGSKLAIEVVGHTDNSGSESSNRPLSQDRSEYVTRRLIENGVGPGTLEPRGAGTSEPVEEGDSETARRLNRSVTFRVVRSKSPLSQ